MTAFDASLLWRLHRVGTPQPSPDGSFAIVSVGSADLALNRVLTRLYRVPTDGGPAHPLTQEGESASDPALSPDGRWLAFLRTPSGEKQPQLHLLDLQGGGEARRLTRLPLGAGDPRFLPDGSGVVVRSSVYRQAPDLDGTRARSEALPKEKSTARVTEDRMYRFWDHWLTDGEVSHLFRIDRESGEVRDLTPTCHKLWDPMDPDGSYDVDPTGEEAAFAAIVAEPPFQIASLGIYQTRVGTGEVSPLAVDPAFEFNRPRYSPDGRFLLYGRRPALEYVANTRMVLRDRLTGQERVLLPDWDRSAQGWEFLDAQTVVFLGEDQGCSRLCLVPVDGSSAVPQFLVTPGTVSAVRPAGGRLFFSWDDLCHPPEVAWMEASSGPSHRMGAFNDSLVEGIQWGKVEEIRYPGFAGEEVQMFLLRPPGDTGQKPLPLVHFIHGGPYGYFADHWHWRWHPQVVAARGYAVAMVNFHGSASYGHAFARSILGHWGEVAPFDVEVATDWLLAQGIVDEKRMAIAGGSFGGYMACFIPTFSHRYVCSVAHAACFDLANFMASDITQDVDLELGGAPWNLPADALAVEKWDPRSHTENYRTPTLVIHGEKDYRVPVGQGLALYGMLKAKKVPARLVYYPDENHWILAPGNSLHWYGEVLGWLERFLGKGEGA